MRPAQLTAIRRAEQRRMQEYMRAEGCLMQFLAVELDDPQAAPCGKCANCRGRGLPSTVEPAGVAAAAEFLRRTRVVIEPRKRWPEGGLECDGFAGSIADCLIEPGRALARWGDGGWAELVRRGKYEDGRFDDAILAASVALIRDWRPQPAPKWVAWVPSKTHPELVPAFARALAGRLRLPCAEAVLKVRENASQKTRENSVQQARNLDGAFTIDRRAMLPGPVLLVDDIVDSRWTLTVIGALLRRAGVPAVVPFVLADASNAG